MSDTILHQQVNLYQPILGAERRLFSARAIGLALAVMAGSLALLAFYGSRRTGRIENSLAQLAGQEAASITMAEHAGLTVQPGANLDELGAAAKRMSAEIEQRQRALDIIRRDNAPAATGFAARLEALGRRQLSGVWLTAFVLGSGEQRLALRGSSTEPKLLPLYLAGLAQEPALAGVSFDKLAMRQAKPQESPARVFFELDGPQLPLPAPGRDPAR